MPLRTAWLTKKSRELTNTLNHVATQPGEWSPAERGILASMARLRDMIDCVTATRSQSPLDVTPKSPPAVELSPACDTPS